jgi:hypothetical protein
VQHLDHEKPQNLSQWAKIEAYLEEANKDATNELHDPITGGIYGSAESEDEHIYGDGWQPTITAKLHEDNGNTATSGDTVQKGPMSSQCPTTQMAENMFVTKESDEHLLQQAEKQKTGT